MTVATDLSTHLDTLERQQNNLTDALRAMLEGNWQGDPPSLEALLYAQNPALGGTLVPRTPVRVSDQAPAPRTFMARFDPTTPMTRQENGWTCSVCAQDWVLRATGVAPDHTRALGLDEIGYPHNVNETYGLMDGSGSKLREVYARYGLDSTQGWLSFDEVYAAAGETTGQMSGGVWYHWVAIRGRDGENLWIANSAPGYKNVSESLSRDDFNRLGPFSVVLLVP
jgi:hypothetical protein